MTNSPETSPTLEQRAATITELCPPGWRTTAYGPSLAIFHEGHTAPYSVMNADNESIVAAIWKWYADAQGHKQEPNVVWLREQLAATETALKQVKDTEIPAQIATNMADARSHIDRAVTFVEQHEGWTIRAGQDFHGLLLQAQRALAGAQMPDAMGTMTRLEVGHALWLCGYHPGDDPRKVFATAAKRGLEWMEIEALLTDDLKKAREEDPACTVETLVESLRDDAHAFAEQLGRQDTELQALRAARRDLRVYEMDSHEGGVLHLAEQATALFASLPMEAIEARSYDLARRAEIAVRIVGAEARERSTAEQIEAAFNTERVRVDFNAGDPAARLRTTLDEIAGLPEDLIERLAWYGQRENRHTPYEPQDLLVRVVLMLANRMVTLEAAPVANTADMDLRGADPAKVVAAMSTPLEPRIVNKPAEKRELNIIDEVHGPGFADEYLGKTSRRYETGLLAQEEIDRIKQTLVRAPAPVTAVVGESEAGPYSKQETVDAKGYTDKHTPINATKLDARGIVVRWTGSDWEEVRLRPIDIPVTITGVDGSVPVRAAGWTGITWMSGKGRAKSLTVPGLRFESTLPVGCEAFPNALMLAADVEQYMPLKLRKVLDRSKRLYTFHLPNGVKRYGTVVSWSHCKVGQPCRIAARLTSALSDKPAPKPVRQGIAWRRPSADVDSFAEVPIRPTFDNAGRHVVEVHAELPDALRCDLKQSDGPMVTITTVNGATLKGPITAWQVQRDQNGVVWRLTMPLPMGKLPT